jgi:dual specificity phosphatase 12
MSTLRRPAIPQDLGIKHKFILLEDDASANLLGVLDEACTFLDDALKPAEEGKVKAKVLVHCLQGISRSGAVVVAYTMKRLNFTYGEALDAVRQARAIVMPNSGFEEQLELWGEMGCCTKDGDGKETVSYKEWKERREETLGVDEEYVSRERAKGMARLAARIGKMRDVGREV